MRNSAMTLLVALAIIVSMGCVPGPKSSKGFTLPEGDTQTGKEVYINLQCNACHKISGVDQLAAENGEESTVSVRLGGEVNRIKTYGELVTGIINPSHKLARGYAEADVSIDGASSMKNYNDVMTVSELIDLVAFLQSKYKLREIEPTDYPMYGP